MQPELREFLEAYLRLTLHILKFGTIRLTEVVPDLRPEEEQVLAALLALGSGTVDEVTEELRARRGRASRNTVRARLRSMALRGLVEVSREGRRVVYRPSRVVLVAWLRFLGIKLDI